MSHNYMCLNLYIKMVKNNSTTVGLSLKRKKKIERKTKFSLFPTTRLRDSPSQEPIKWGEVR